MVLKVLPVLALLIPHYHHPEAGVLQGNPRLPGLLQHPHALLATESLGFTSDFNPLRLIDPSFPFQKRPCMVIFPSSFKSPTASSRPQPVWPALQIIDEPKEQDFPMLMNGKACKCRNYISSNGNIILLSKKSMQQMPLF